MCLDCLLTITKISRSTLELYLCNLANLANVEEFNIAALVSRLAGGGTPD